MIGETPNLIDNGVLEAHEGMKLTQSGDVAPEDRVFTSRVELAPNDSALNWIEVPLAQALEFRAMRESDIADSIENF